MKNEEAIEQIVSQENKVSNQKTYLWVAFFLVSLAVGVIVFMTLKNYHSGSEKSAVIILTTYTVYALLLFAGWFYDRYLSKKLERLWNEKKLLF